MERGMEAGLRISVDVPGTAYIVFLLVDSEVQIADVLAEPAKSTVRNMVWRTRKILT